MASHIGRSATVLTTSIRLLRRDAAASPAISIVSIAVLAVGAGALVLSVTVVTAYIVHNRRAKRRRMQAKMGSEAVMHSVHASQSTLVLPDQHMTPAMRLAYATRMGGTPDVERGMQGKMVYPLESSQFARRGTMASQASMQNTLSSGPYPPSSSQRTMQVTSGSDYTQPSISMSVLPPMPEDSLARIQMTRQQDAQRAVSSSRPPSKAASVKSGRSSRKPSHSHSREKSKSRSTVPPELLEGLGELPQLPIAASTKGLAPASRNNAQPSSKKSAAARASTSAVSATSESLTPVLDLGLDFGSALTAPSISPKYELDAGLMEQSSWLASALDSAFGAEEGSFADPPRRAPLAPSGTIASIAPLASLAPVRHTATLPISISRTTVVSPAPRPASPAKSVPKKHEKPTTGGAARVTVSYSTPYQRRTLHRDSDDMEPMEELMGLGRPSLTVDDAQGRTSMESTLQTAAALFTSMEPVLRSGTASAPNASLDMSSSARSAVDTTVSTTAQDRSTSFEDGNTTLNTSVADVDQQRRGSDETSESKHGMPIALVNRTEEEADDVSSSPPPFQLEEFTTQMPKMMPTLTIPSQLMKECQDALSDAQPSSSLRSPVNGQSANTATLTPSKSGFAASLRAKFTLNRPRSTASGSAASSPNLSAKSPPMGSAPFPPHSTLSPHLPVIERLSPAMSDVSMMQGTPNSFGPPTETWNVSTEDVGMPSFIQPPALAAPTPFNASGSAANGPTFGLGLQRGPIDRQQDSLDIASSDGHGGPRIMQASSRPAFGAHAKQASVTLERNASVSSYGSSRQDHAPRSAPFPWSRRLAPVTAYDVDGGAPLSPAMEELRSTASSPRFADAESPNASPPPPTRFGGLASSIGHASAGHSMGHSLSQGRMMDEQRWMLDRGEARPRDSIASSYCDTIRSSVTGMSDVTGGAASSAHAFDTDNAQIQRARLLQSVQKRQEARRVERQPSQKRTGFTSHSASLSIDVGQGPTNSGRRLDVNVGTHFMAGAAQGVLTPPLTPFEKTIPLPSEENEAVAELKIAVARPAHARIAPLTAEERQAERLSKLRPLSLAAVHAQNGGATNVNRRISNSSGVSSHLPVLHHQQSSSHRSNASRSSSAFGLSPSSSFTSALGNLPGGGPTTSSTSSASSHAALARAGLLADAHASKRVSRASSNGGGSTTGGQCPMGAVHATGLSTTLIGVLPTLPAESNPSFLPSATTRISPATPTKPLSLLPRRPSQQQDASGMLHAQSAWGSSVQGSPLLDGSASPSAASARLSGSSYASHSSILNRFPALAGTAVDTLAA